MQARAEPNLPPYYPHPSPITPKKWTHPMSREFPKNPELKITRPTVGRIVHVWPQYCVAPLAGIVALVHKDNDLVINVGVVSHEGNMGGLKDVPHVSMSPNNEQPYWDWMDYQKGLQRAEGGAAAKADKLEERIDEMKAPLK